MKVVVPWLERKLWWLLWDFDESSESSSSSSEDRRQDNYDDLLDLNSGAGTIDSEPSLGGDSTDIELG